MLIELLVLLNIPILITYYEVVFNMTTTASMSGRTFLLTLLCSIFYGLLIAIPCSLPRNYRTRRTLRGIASFVIFMIFIIEEFVYMEFKTLYDLNTILSGGADATKTYKKTIKDLLLSKQGLIGIFIYLLPLILYVLQIIILRHGKHESKRYISKKVHLTGLVSIIISTTLCTSIITSDQLLRENHTKRYTFSNSVRTFGLLDSMRQEVVILFSRKEVTFTAVNTDSLKPIEDSLSSGRTKNPVIPPITDNEPKTPEKEYSMLDIDFDSIIANDSETYKHIDEYVAGLTPSKTNAMTGLFEGKNLILITAEAFSGFIISEELTPTLYRLANKGFIIEDYYQPCTAGTTGGECASLFGMIPVLGGDSVKVTADNINYFTMGNALNRLGYQGKAYHNNDYTYYDRDKTHVNLGYSDGFLGMGNGMEAFVQNTWPQSDLEMFEGTVDDYIDKEHFSVYYMTVSGHGDYTPGSNYIGAKNFDRVEKLDLPDNTKRYIAANLEFEDAMTYLVNRLEEKGLMEDTVIVITGDHYPYALDDNSVPGNLPLLSQLYGYNVTNYIMREKNRLIIWSGCLENNDPIRVDTPVSSIDILPTLLNLFGVDWDSRLLPGRDIFSDALPLVFTADRDWISEYGIYLASTGNFTKTADVTLPDDYTKNVNALVDNKLNYCLAVLQNDYYRHLVDAGALR